jgi:hypothetical protein
VGAQVEAAVAAGGGDVQVGEAGGLDRPVVAQADRDSDVGRQLGARDSAVGRRLVHDAEDVAVGALDIGAEALSARHQPVADDEGGLALGLVVGGQAADEQQPRHQRHREHQRDGGARCRDRMATHPCPHALKVPPAGIVYP